MALDSKTQRDCRITGRRLRLGCVFGLVLGLVWTVEAVPSQPATSPAQAAPIRLMKQAKADPMKLVVTKIDTTGIKVKWKKTRKTTKWLLEAFADAKLKKKVFSKRTKKTTAWVRGAKIKAETKYYMRVTTINRPRKLKSAKIKAKTGTLIPATPGGLTVRPTSATTISLAWKAANLAKAYEVRLSPTPYGPATWTKRVKATQIETLRIWLNGMQLDRVFYVRVASVRGDKVSGPSAVVATAVPLPTPSVKPSFTALVGSYNVLRRDQKDAQKRTFYERSDLVAKRIRQWDIAGLQEATFALWDGARPIEVLEGSSGLTLSRNPATGSVCSRHSDHVLYRAARFELADCGEDQLSGRATEERYMAWSVLTEIASGRQVLVVSTHLAAGIGATKHTYRMAEVNQLLGFVAEHNPTGLPVIMTGDFNEAALDYTVTVPVVIGKAGYQSADLVAPVTANISWPSFHGFVTPSYTNNRIDYIFTSWLAVVDSFSVVKESPSKAPSDHFPITAQLTIY